jgi:hypothetical protein
MAACGDLQINNGDVKAQKPTAELKDDAGDKHTGLHHLQMHKAA